MQRGRAGYGSARAVRLALSAVVGTFLVCTLVSQSVLTSDLEALDIADNAAPSIVHLADARAALRPLERAAIAHASDAAAGGAELDRHRRALDDALTRYAMTPEYPGERALYQHVVAALGRFDELSRSGGSAPALRAVIDDLERELYSLSELNRRYLHASADEVLRRGRRFAIYCVLLDGLAVLVALGTMWLVTRTLRDYLGRLERRSSELEHLAVQIGHEIGNPLTPVTLALESCASIDAAAAARGKKAIARIRASVDRLIGFASAGDARRVPAEGTAVASVLDACGVHVDGGVDARVAFEPEALRDVVSDLVKVSSEPPLLLDHVEVQLRPSHVRLIAVCSVSDGNTRPADPFEPQMHGVGSGHPGIDLRLATARRCIEARGGAVGVRDRGRERRLWIDLART